jgi:hypothetical protein
MNSAAAGIAYLAVYGGGAALGMAVIAGLAGMPLARIARGKHGMLVLLGTTGTLSLGLGLTTGWTALAAALVR